jgi:uncharacterized protein YqgC (DUF456 family)
MLLSLLLGLGLWNGAWWTLLGVHQALGILMTAGLLGLAVLGFARRLSPGLPLLALLWSAALLVLGIIQQRLLPGGSHWVVEALHLLLGLGAAALAELIGSRLRGTVARTPRPAPVTRRI